MVVLTAYALLIGGLKPDINALKAYEGQEIAVCCAIPEFVEQEELSSCYLKMSSPPPDIMNVRFYNTQARAVQEETLHHLTEAQRQDVIHLVMSRCSWVNQ